MPITVDITQKPGFLNTTLQTLDLFVLSGAGVHTQMGPLQNDLTKTYTCIYAVKVESHQWERGLEELARSIYKKTGNVQRNGHVYGNTLLLKTFTFRLFI
jgi:hypothetical protein